MNVRIAIPVPSSDVEYNGRSLPPYVEALEAAGASVVVVDLIQAQQKVAKLLAGVQGILLPGSRFDVDPERYGETRTPECGEADDARTAVDELLLQDAFNLRKPILAICHGTQTLNVWRNGSLIQDLKTEVNHRPGRTVVDAHPVKVAQGSRLAALLPDSGVLETAVNSSHHQAISVPGDNLRVTAVSPHDGVIEAVELDSPDHFVLAVQWHPERTCSESAVSRSIFKTFVEAAAAWQPPLIEDSVMAK
ncbi:MAG TPA: gamma-glutamyl-gamma-aminobutyrate hydrolase family protein [Terracidiphilus sp.]|nr:gamma-glutamyl-gamma-aminobutyrate hydrolase family protein [Terracidiphilus sp.]